MQTVSVEIPAELAHAMRVEASELSAETTRLLALDLYRAERVSLGRAAELCGISIGQFLDFAAKHQMALSYSSADLNEDRRTLERLGL